MHKWRDVNIFSNFSTEITVNNGIFYKNHFLMRDNCHILFLVEAGQVEKHFQRSEMVELRGTVLKWYAHRKFTFVFRMLSPGQDAPPSNYSSGNVVLQGAPCGQCRDLCPAGYVPHFWRWVPIMHYHRAREAFLVLAVLPRRTERRCKPSIFPLCVERKGRVEVTLQKDFDSDRLTWVGSWGQHRARDGRIDKTLKKHSSAQNRRNDCNGWHSSCSSAVDRVRVYICAFLHLRSRKKPTEQCVSLRESIGKRNLEREIDR